MPKKLEFPELEHSKSWFIDKYLADLNHPLKAAVRTLVLSSDYACRHIELLLTLLSTDNCAALLTRDDYFLAMEQINQDSPLPTFQQALRQFRHWHFLRLLLLGYAQRASTQEIMESWSDCADAIILYSLEYLKLHFSTRYGLPRLESGVVAELYTLAMGKLGGRELNFSSDIDLIFAFTGPGMTDGVESCTNEHFFIKMVQQLITLLQTVTVDGFVFRVDLRLRPNGDSGALVSSLDAMETYYQEQGRDWERYAMVKARVIARDVGQQQPWFARLILPFVYRRYVDFSVIESLRSMKAMIEREVQLNPRLDDIKRGEGGIREVEFVIQNFQLIRGGRMPQLQRQNAMAALAALKQEQLLPHSDALRQAYLFLRALENTLQSLNDQQTHSLPEDALKQAQVTLAMGYLSWEALIDRLQQYQRIIRHSFHSILEKVDEYGDEKRLLANQLSSLWQGHVETNMAVNWLAGLGYKNAEHCYQMVYAFRHSPRCRRLSQGARMRLDRFMVLLFTELTQVAKTDEVLLHVLHLLENIVGRSAYLALLTENPQALKELLFWFANSPFITSLMVSQPFLLDVLLETEKNWRPPSKRQLELKLAEQLSHADDVELQQEILRQFKLTYWLMAARAELSGSCHAVRSGQFLSDVAEVIVNQVFAMASKELGIKQPDMERVKDHFAIIAYGKLGSREMNYSSDLDLVFLHNTNADEEAWVTRLTQKILHMLTTRSQAGVLYAVDTRLRPSGAAGLLVSHVDAFIEYQRTQAWTWEHQALLKARVIKGNSKIKRAFASLKKSILVIPRDHKQLQEDVLSMRAKIVQLKDADVLKHRPGGLLDLEFLLQFLVLLVGQPRFARYTHTASLLQQLLAVQAISEEQFTQLEAAYKEFHYLLHQSILKPSCESGELYAQQVVAVCKAIYAAGDIIKSSSDRINSGV